LGTDGEREGAERSGERLSLVQSVSRAARVMKALLYSGSRVSQAQVAAEMGLHKTTVMRLLHTLEAEGLVRRDPTGSYGLAMDFWLALAARNPDALTGPRLIQALLDELARATGETVLLALADSSRRAVTTVMWAEGHGTVHVDPRHLGPIPMHAVSSGKCCLASLSNTELREWIKAGLPRVTEYTITSPTRLVTEIRRVRKRGYATSLEEGVQRLGGLAVPVTDGAGQALGGVQVFTLAQDLTEANLQRWLPLLRGAADRLSPLLRMGLTPGTGL
jgi:DNA-binding IclR family transcriptional regulator